MTKSLLITLTLIFSGLILEGQSAFTVKNHTILIEGTSSLHDWVSTANTVEASGKIMVEEGMLTGIQGLTVAVTVEDIKSEKGRIMDNKTHKALQSDDNPKITYQLGSIQSINKTSNGYELVTDGKLTIAGETRPVTFTTTATVLDEHTLKFEGAYPMMMSTFDIDPPTAMLGALKTGDEITVKYVLTVQTKQDLIQ